MSNLPDDAVNHCSSVVGRGKLGTQQSTAPPFGAPLGGLDFYGFLRVACVSASMNLRNPEPPRRRANAEMQIRHGPSVFLNDLQVWLNADAPL